MDQFWSWVTYILEIIRILVPFICVFSIWIIWYRQMVGEGGSDSRSGGSGRAEAANWSGTLRTSIGVAVSGVIIWVILGALPSLIPALGGSVQGSLGL